jgi:hypothetical protein
MKTSPTRAQLIKSGVIRPTQATAQKPRDNQAALLRDEQVFTWHLHAGNCLTTI